MVHDRGRLPRFYGSLDQRVWTMGELEGGNGLLENFERDSQANWLLEIGRRQTDVGWCSRLDQGQPKGRGCGRRRRRR